MTHSKTHEIIPSKEDIGVAFLLHNCIAKLGKCKTTKYNPKHTCLGEPMLWLESSNKSL